MNRSANGGALGTWTPKPAHVAERPRTPKTARRRASWLIAAWIAFWLVIVIQPCCDASAGAVTTVALADNQPQSDGHPHEVPACPEFTAFGFELTNIPAAPSAPATAVIARPAGAAVTLPFHDAVDQRSSYSTPSPSLAVYLSTSRLLI
jgi:hypothetical protein